MLPGGLPGARSEMRLLVATLVVLLAADARAGVRRAADDGGEEVLGAVGARAIARGESLIEIAREHDVGFHEIMAANPRLDPFVPRPGATAVIPTGWILPRAVAPGTVVVNLSEMRLYLLDRGTPVTFPVGVGGEGWLTPVGTYTVVARQVRPTWYPTPSIRRENPELPLAVPPGPENPLGSHALRLSSRSILIHGTNTPWAIGRKASHGCLRLYPEDIPVLYDLVPVGTWVTIVREPVKVGLRRGRVHVEVHEDEDLALDLAGEARRLLEARGLAARADAAKLARAVEERRGIPVDVTADAPAGATASAR